MRGPGPQTAPETPLCLPVSPLFKTKTKSPTPPSALQHPRPRGRTDGGRRTLHMPAVRGMSARRFLVSWPGWERQASPRKLGKYLWEYIKIRHKQLSAWGINSPVRAPAPSKYPDAQRIWSVWPRAQSPGITHAVPLHKERPAGQRQGCVSSQFWGRGKLRPAAGPGYRVRRHPYQGRGAQRPGPGARLTQCAELRNMLSRVTGTFKVLTYPCSAQQRSQGQV